MFDTTLRLLRIVAIVAIVLSLLSLVGLSIVQAHEGEEAPWLPVHQVEGNLVVAPDPSLSQWTESHHAHSDGLDGVEADLMSVHNGTYWVVMVERTFNISISNAGVSLFVNGTLFSSPNAIWGWVGGQSNSTDPSVVSQGSLVGEDLTVVFGRPLATASGSEAKFDIGIAYDDAIKVTSWNNGTAATALNYDGVESMGLELLPHLDIFPRTPFVYATVLLAGTAAFMVIEFRRYRP